MPFEPSEATHKRIAELQAQGRCGKRFRRNMYEDPFSRICIKPAHEGGRHSDNPDLLTPPSKQAPTGTCQACFRNDLKLPNQRLSKHGYQRPGFGYIVGECIGSHELPYSSSHDFPNSCEVTKRMKEVVERHLASQQKRLSDLQAGPEQFDTYVRAYVGRENTTAKEEGMKLIPVTVKKGDEAREFDTEFSHYGRPYKAHVEAYDRILARSIRDTESAIAQSNRDIEFLTEQIQAWVPVA